MRNLYLTRNNQTSERLPIASRVGSVKHRIIPIDQGRNTEDWLECPTSFFTGSGK